MKKFLSAIILPACLVLFSCNNKKGGEAITLKFNLPAGSTYDYNVDMDMAMSGVVNGQSVNIKDQMGMGYRFAAVSDSAGWKTISATINRIAMHMNTNGVDIDFDSDKEADSTGVVSGTVGKVLGALKGGHFGFTMNEKGQIGKITGINDMMQRIMTSINVPATDAMAAGASSTFNEENFKQNIQQSFGMYPDKPVKPGDAWTNTIDMNSQGTPMKIDNTYTLESVTGDTAHVKVDSKISSPGADVTGITGTMTGKMNFDIPTGLPADGNLNMNMHMTMNTGGQVVPMNMVIDMKITGKKS